MYVTAQGKHSPFACCLKCIKMRSEDLGNDTRVRVKGKKHSHLAGMRLKTCNVLVLCIFELLQYEIQSEVQC